MASPRDRMVASAAVLIRERGAHSTAISDVLEHSGAPRGSAYHYFPGGRTQLLCEAVDFASDHVAAQIGSAATGLEVLDAIVAGFRRQLTKTGFRAGCPVVAVAVEAGDPLKDENVVVLERAGAAFVRWTDLITQQLVDDGTAEDRAQELAVFLTAAIEGAVVMARATRDVGPLDSTHRELRSLLQAERGSVRDER
ncbi:TetR/AcrR family transcriptional regulator [Mycolicibacterium hodleri]|uniref:TetR/AcrR family transcriptional regulator n=1 Tax=Mycolicibacterium hodleri TaxID=49897 RepID=A0A502E9G1_9MYCO|nr:TetR/AcrR family transcriptional regulator [Mycolicibacterium hodleri]TPG33639.1 TetR/AcrR family transcriptional regulator [Mycolicibacterium hodleri]